MNIIEKIQAVADEFVGTKEENRERGALLIVFDKKKGSIRGVVKGKARVVEEGLLQVICDKDSTNKIGETLRKVNMLYQLNQLTDDMDRLMGELKNVLEAKEEKKQ